ncbi:hypothetical protein M569_16317 [Genlisea aurea]|uniref:NET domain-containing protein n=1 Tax=Genlisea aurea TaxID=192259 RepID=S8DGK6_9LAMI|nr:hypothetical protein M569_16317 [Genlisea aurea]
MKNNEVGPDFFCFYKSEVAELLSQDEELLPFPHQFTRFPETNQGNKSLSNSRSAQSVLHDSSSALFSNGVGALLSEYRRERLNSTLRQSVDALSHEVEEIAGSVLSVCRLRSALRCKETQHSAPVTSQHPNHAQKKIKVSPPTSTSEDLSFLLENESSKVEEVINKHSDDLSDTLVHMEQNLEELLNTTMTTCRSMTSTEKEQLCKFISMLSPGNLDGVAEILHRVDSTTPMHVDLEEEVSRSTMYRIL